VARQPKRSRHRGAVADSSRSAQRGDEHGRPRGTDIGEARSCRCEAKLSETATALARVNLNAGLPATSISCKRHALLCGRSGPIVSAKERCGFCWLRLHSLSKRVYGDSPNDGHRQRCYALHSQARGLLHDKVGQSIGPLSWAAINASPRANRGAAERLRAFHHCSRDVVSTEFRWRPL
jgi:hypothetical protein